MPRGLILSISPYRSPILVPSALASVFGVPPVSAGLTAAEALTFPAVLLFGLFGAG